MGARPKVVELQQQLIARVLEMLRIRIGASRRRSWARRCIVLEGK
jgi:hypothetical protein